MAYFGVYELLKEAAADKEGKVSSSAILCAGGFAGELASWDHRPGIGGRVG